MFTIILNLTKTEQHVNTQDYQAHQLTDAETADIVATPGYRIRDVESCGIFVEESGHFLQVRQQQNSFQSMVVKIIFGGGHPLLVVLTPIR